MTSRVLYAVFSIRAFVASAFALWCGLVMSFLVPGGMGEPYFQRDLLYGEVPLAYQFCCCPPRAGCSSVPYQSRISHRQAIISCFVAAAGLGFAFAVVSAIFQGL